jgi:hypothetical protein
VTRHAQAEYIEAVRTRYAAASKDGKGRILDELCEATGRHRKAAIRSLTRPARSAAARRGRPPVYGADVRAALTEIWQASGQLCGKLLVAVMPVYVAALARQPGSTLRTELRAHLQHLSAATIDRLLQPARRRRGRQPRANSPALSAIAAQIPIRTWGDWDAVRPGALQGDLVLHCGESAGGFFLVTLVAVDVATGWTELEPVWGLGHRRVGSAVHYIRERLPMPLQAWHSDNGGHFINETLLTWVRREGITFTRGRTYRKNDQAYVEQRNWLAVRRIVGYDRYSSRAALTALHEVYRLLRVQLNFLRPLRKLVAKQRSGATVHKHYDHPRTPYQRLCAAGVLTPEQRKLLDAHAAAIDPIALARALDRALDTLWKTADRRGSVR